jgi:hypothetical protein
MSVFEHGRTKIFNPAQHPLKHDISDLAYTNAKLPGISLLVDAIGYLINVVYPNYKGTVATPADLPVSASAGDYYIVTDDGDTKSAGYVYTVIDGVSSWKKRYDVDWSADNILAEFIDKTQWMYVHKYGKDDTDGAGIFVGQRCYGGASTNTNLTFNANSYDTTGFIQFENTLRPTADGTLDLGHSSYKFKDILLGGSAYVNTMTLSTGSIIDSTGNISFGNENLSTTGTMAALSFNGLTLTAGSNAFTITQGTSDLNVTADCTLDQELATTANPYFASIAVKDTQTGSTKNLIITSLSTTAQATVDRVLTLDLNNGDRTLALLGNLTVESASIINQDLSTDSLTAQIGTMTASTSFLSSLFSHSNSLTISTTANNGDITLTPHGTGAVKTDNLAFDGNTIASLDTNGNVVISPNGNGLVSVTANVVPSAAGKILGADGYEFGGIYLQGAGKVYDDTGTPQEFLVSELMALKSANFRDAGRTQAAQSGDALFFNGTQWLASAPDSEIAHSGLTGLTTTDAGHTQFAMLTGRAGGQTIQGGTAASELLVLESTAHGTKGTVQTKNNFLPFTNAAYSGGWSGIDLGGASNNYNNIYMKGEAKGLRLENVASTQASSAQNVGRVMFNTTSKAIEVDDGSSVGEVGVITKYLDHTWSGNVATYTYDVSTITSAATTHGWMFVDNNANYEPIYAKIEVLTATTVKVTVNENLPNQAYRLLMV